ncbi:MAG: response regulator [Deferrisomatales bacterium]
MGGSRRLVLAEDHAILRDGLRAILALEPELEVVGEAADGREAIWCADRLRPDLTILDLTMPRMNGMEAIGEIKRVSPHTRVLVLTVHKSEEYVLAALRAGADGYVLKDATADEVLHAVRTVLDGHRCLSPEISDQGVRGFLDSKGTDGLRTPFSDLTVREREVLKLVAEGHRTRDIGEFLCISPKTVEKHRTSLMRKLDLHTVSELTTYALDKGLVASR